MPSQINSLAWVLLFVFSHSTYCLAQQEKDAPKKGWPKRVWQVDTSWPLKSKERVNQEYHSDRFHQFFYEVGSFQPALGWAGMGAGGMGYAEAGYGGGSGAGMSMGGMGGMGDGYGGDEGYGIGNDGVFSLQIFAIEVFGLQMQGMGDRGGFGTEETSQVGYKIGKNGRCELELFVMTPMEDFGLYGGSGPGGLSGGMQPGPGMGGPGMGLASPDGGMGMVGRDESYQTVYVRLEQFANKAKDIPTAFVMSKKEVQAVSEFIKLKVWRNKLVQRIEGNSKDPSFIEDAEPKLKQLLAEQYTNKLDLQELEVAAIESKVKQLREEIARRQSAKQKVVDVQAGRIILEAQGLLDNSP
ncbi:MAG: hypothetical protein AAF483_05015 [Planctomycetota bacterium]